MKLLIFDANSIVNRAFYAIRNLSNSKGTPTNAIHGFLNALLKFKEELSPDMICAAFDLKGPTFRHEMFGPYKATRTGMPDELAAQIEPLKEILGLMGVNVLQKESYEADDIIGTVSSFCDQNAIECAIVTGDKDSLQLITQNTVVHLASTSAGKAQSTVMDESALFDLCGLTPEQMIGVKALMGDSSDNIPGVQGIGEKTALSLIKRYGSVEKIYEDIDSLDEKPGVIQKLKDGKDMAFLSKQLGTINKEVPIDISADIFLNAAPDLEKLFEVLSELELKSIIERLGISGETKKETRDICETPVDESDALSHFKDKKTAYYFLKGDKFYFTQEGELKYFEPSDDFLVDFFPDRGIEKITYDAKEQIVRAKKLGVDFERLAFDVVLAGYVIDPSKSPYTLKKLTIDLLDKAPFEDEHKNAVYLKDLHEKMAKKMGEAGLEGLYYDIELPLSHVLADMEFLGFKVDKGALLFFGEKLTKEIKKEEDSIYAIAGLEFNINSTKQLGEILFEGLGLPPLRKTKTGYSTDSDVLKKLRPYHEIIEHIENYRKLSKLMSTYVDGLIPTISPDGRIHSTFNQALTQTGRISSQSPNLQNIPVRTLEGREIRKVFLAKEGCVLVDADYSQIELRILAHISGDENMISAFRNKEDIHAITASQVMGVPLNEVTAQMRSDAKAVNFGIVYGIGDYSLSEDLKISRKEARQYIDTYLEKYSGVKKYMDDVVLSAKERGYVKTLLGRMRYIPELQSRNAAVREFGKRVAMNTPIQGSAADIIKIAMVNVVRRLSEENLKSRLILQVHDELIVEAHLDEVERVKDILVHEMKGAFDLRVEMDVDVYTGRTWDEAKG